MKMDFTGKRALVTGGSRGIGLQVARDLVDAGASVIITSTREADADRLTDTLGSDAEHVAVDFSDPESTKTILDYVRELPELHVCVNNAAVAEHGPYDTTTEAYWHRAVDVNLKAPYFTTSIAADHMKRQRYGRIVNISSIWGHISRQGRTVYATTKFGIRGMSVTFALELASSNVLVNVVSPGFTLTDMARRNYTEEELSDLRGRVPMGRLAETEDVSRAVLFLASDLNSYITGQSLIVDGGFSVA
jgi:3-oxoacyl-[acyl-carrier protein] reductase